MNKVGIIGGGASGILCAITIKRNCPEAEVIILEKQSRIGTKILKTGNGKCNLSNLNLSVSDYNTDIFLDSLQKFDAKKCIEFFENLGLMVRIDESGRIYPYSERATSVLDILLFELKRLNIKIICDFNVIDVKKADHFIVYSDQYLYYKFDYLVLATGGKAAINFENNGYDLAERLGHHVTSLHPGLVGLKVLEKTSSLSGLRMKSLVSIVDSKISSYGEIQFKKDGLSGIPILNISRYCKKNTVISLDLIPDKNNDEIFSFFTHRNYEETLMGILPKMIAKDIIKRSDKELYSIVNILKDYRFTVTSNYGFKNAQITVGGINYKEVFPLDFKSLITNNLYIIGEMLDIDGKCGGYNLHFAWLSGYLSGFDIARKIGGRGSNCESI